MSPSLNSSHHDKRLEAEHLGANPQRQEGPSRLILFNIMLHEVVDVIKKHQAASDAEDSSTGYSHMSD